MPQPLEVANPSTDLTKRRCAVAILPTTRCPSLAEAEVVMECGKVRHPCAEHVVEIRRKGILCGHVAGVYETDHIKFSRWL